MIQLVTNVHNLQDLYAGPAAQLLICLLAAHTLGDFLLQTRHDVAKKRRASILFRHAFLHAALTYVIVGDWTGWLAPVAVLVSHAGIDAIKVRLDRGTARGFLFDQAAHGLVLVGLAVASTRLPVRLSWVELLGAPYLQGLILVTGTVVTVLTGGYLIGLLVQPLLAELEAASGGQSELLGVRRGFVNGGMIIGRLERLLIFLFVLAGNPAGVGFLFAAKSILRFGEVRDPAHRMEAEYIIIGTLMSFAYGLIASYGTLALLRLAG